MKNIFLFIFLLFIPKLSSQIFYNVGIENGLSSHQAYDVVQDKNGFVWISTKVGIDRYDGENMINYPFPANDRVNSIQRLHLRTDTSKKLWAYTTMGRVYAFEEGHNQFELKLSLSDSLESNVHLINLFCDKDIWLCTNKGLWLHEPDINSLKEIEIFKGRQVNSVIQYSLDTYLISIPQEIIRYNHKMGTATSLFNLNKLKKQADIMSLYYHKHLNEIWIGTQSGDVFVYNLSSKTIVNLKDNIKELPAVPVFKIIASSGNYVYVGSDGGGVFELDAENKTIVNNYRENEDNMNTLVGNGVRDLLLANSGNLFVTTYTGGLNILSKTQTGFRVIRHEINDPNSLRNNVVNNLLEDTDGDIWFATNNGVSCWLKHDGKWKHYLDDPKGMANVFLSLEQYDKNIIVAGSYGKGLYFIHKQKGVIDHIFPGEHTSPTKNQTDHIVEIFKDSQGRLWIGDTFKNMVVYDHKRKDSKTIPIRSALSIQAKDEEHLFVGTTSGIFEVNTQTFSIKKIQVQDGLNQTLFVNNLNYDKEHKKLWIATSGVGLINLHVPSGNVEILDINKGLPSNHIYSVLLHDENNVWASSEKGLISYNVKNKNIENFSLKDGLSDEAFYKNSKLKTKAGEFYFGSYQGVTHFNPEKIKYQNEKASIYLEELLINNKRIYANDKKSPLTKALNQTKDIKLKHNQSSFSIGFTNITSVNSGTIKYSWKLEGQDQGWTLASYNKRANYTNVPEGKFIFSLRAISDRTDEVIDERHINVVVKTAPWNTLLARIAYALIFLGMLILVFKYLRISDLKKLSETKIQFFTNTAHDIKTPLTLALAPLGDLKKSKNLDEHDRYLLDLSVSNISNLNSSVKHLLDFQKSDMGKSQLVLSEVDIKRFINDKFAFFGQLAETKNIDFHCTIECENLKEWIDAAKFEKIIDNLLSNAFKYTKENGEVFLRVSETKSDWKISVKDNGIGIPQLAQNSLFKRYFRGDNAINAKITGTGIGLLLAKNYVLLHKGNITFSSEEEKGTEFVVSFRKGKKHFGGNVTFVDTVGYEGSKQEKAEEGSKRINKKNSRLAKVLIVEDNDKLRDYLCHTLSENYQTLEAEDGLAALEKVELVSPDIIVSDIGMPNMNGIEFTNHVKSKFETSHIPIILLTAYDDHKDVIKGLESGADDYITKPFDSEILIARIENILRNRQKIKNRFIGFTETKIEKDTFSNKRDQEFIEKAILYVEKNIGENDLSREHFAKEMCVSSSLLYKKLKALTGQSPSAFVKSIKLKKAMELIKTGDKTISEIAIETGFSDTKYFSTAFKKFYGKPPSTFL